MISPYMVLALWIRQFVVLLVLVASPLSASEIPQFALSDNIESQSLPTSYWEDMSAIATPAQAKAALMPGDLTAKPFNIPPQRSSHWFAFTLINPTDHTINPIIYVKQSFPNIVNIHYKELLPNAPQAKWVSLLSGTDIPLSQRAVWDLSPTFNLSLAAHQEQTYYLEIHSKIKLFRLDVMIGDVAKSGKFNLAHLTVLKMFFGSVLTLSLITVLMYLSFRDPLYLYYCAYALSFLFVVMFDATIDLLFELPMTDRNLLCLSYNLVMVFFTLFVGKVLDAKRTLPWFNVVLKTIRVLAVILAGLSWYNFAFFSYTLFAIFVLSVLVLVVVIYASVIGRSSDRLLAIGIAAFLSGVLVIRFMNAGLIPSNLFTDHAALFGALVEMVLFLVVLFRRVISLNEDKLSDSLALLHLAQETDRAKSAFLSTVSHELRTPLTSIKGALGLIQAGAFDKNPEKLHPMSAIAYRNTERLHHLIDEILDIGQMEAGEMKFETSPLNLSGLIEESLEANESYGKQHSVKFICSGTEKPLFVNGDPHRLIQVMANLLSNAVKFSAGSENVNVFLTRYEGSLRVSVKDYGCGIPESARATLFNKFTQVDSSNQRRRGGSGLGLSVVKMIIDAHHGHVNFISEVDKGSTFYFDLPELVVSQD